MRNDENLRKVPHDESGSKKYSNDTEKRGFSPQPTTETSQPPIGGSNVDRSNKK